MDVYADWIDACDAVAKEDEEARAKGARGGGHRDLEAPGRGAGAAAQVEDDGDGFIVDDEMDGEAEYGDDI